MARIQKVQLSVASFNVGWVVARIRVAQLSRAHVECGDQHRHKHACGVVFAEFIIDPRQDTRGREVIGGPGFDQRFGHGHEQRRRDALI